MKANAQRAIYLLELAIVVPLLLTLGIGAVTLGRVYQAKQALSAGSETALRCVYPNDAACVAAVGGNARPNYNWYEVAGRGGYQYDRYLYSGESRVLNGPIITNNYFATILRNGIASYQTTNFSSRPIRYSVTGESPYTVMTARSPYFGGSQPLSPSFSLRNERAISYPVAVQLDISNRTIRSDRANQRTLTRTFTIQNPFPPDARTGAGCFVSSDLDRVNASHNISQTNCSANLAQRAQVVVWVTGESHGTGHVTMQLRYANTNISLGGREFVGTGWGNFIPRGVPNSNYINPALLRALHGENYTEWGDYANLFVPYDTPISLDLTVYQDSDSLASWTGDQIRVFTTQQIARTAQGACGTTQPSILRILGDRASTMLAQGCNILAENINLLAATRSVTNTSINVAPREEARALGCLLSREEAGNSALGFGNLEDQEIEMVAQELCPPYESQFECSVLGQSAERDSPPNFGVPETASDVDGRIYQSEEARRICPVPEVGPDRIQAAGQVNPPTISYIEEEQSVGDEILGDNEARRYAPQSCQEEPRVPTVLQQVPTNKLRVEPRSMETHFIPTHGVDPRVLKSFDPRYNCDQFFSEDLSLSGPYLGEQSDLGDCWAATLRSTSVPSRQVTEAYVSFNRAFVRSVFSESPPTLQCNAPVRVINLNPGDRDSDRLIASELGYPQRPPRCSEAGVICRSELASWSGDMTGEVREDFNAAAARGFEAAAAAYPGQQMLECGQLDRSENSRGIEVCVSSSDSERGRVYTARSATRIQMPLVDLSLSISSEAKRLSEASLDR